MSSIHREFCGKSSTLLPKDRSSFVEGPPGFAGCDLPLLWAAQPHSFKLHTEAFRKEVGTGMPLHPFSPRIFRANSEFLSVAFLAVAKEEVEPPEEECFLTFPKWPTSPTSSILSEDPGQNHSLNQRKTAHLVERIAPSSYLAPSFYPRGNSRRSAGNPGFEATRLAFRMGFSSIREERILEPPTAEKPSS